MNFTKIFNNSYKIENTLKIYNNLRQNQLSDKVKAF